MIPSENHPATDAARLRRGIRRWIGFMMIAILISGITAFPVETELAWLKQFHPHMPFFMSSWLDNVYTGIHETNRKYSWLAYGYDWLAFAHIVIALAFIGPWRDPVRNVWIIEWGMLCCALVIPLALIAGPIRDIPFFHQIIDCGFGILGIVPLLIVRRKIKRLEGLSASRAAVCQSSVC